MGPISFGLIFGLLVQGLFFAPFDLPQYGMNITILLIPLYLTDCVAKCVISQKTAYKNIKYWQALVLSTTYQAGIVAWVRFWAFYGEGFNFTTLGNIVIFAFAYMSVIMIELLVDLSVLVIAKNWARLSKNNLVQCKLYHEAI